MHQPTRDSSTILKSEHKDDSEKNISFFPIGWQPGNWDVICQRGRENFDHVGNRRFRVCIDNNLGRYLKAKTKQEKTDIVNSIFDSMSASSPHGGFVKKDLLSGRWYATGEKVSREKISQAIRDAIKQRRVKKDAPTAQSKKSKYGRFDGPSIKLDSLSKEKIHDDRNISNKASAAFPEIPTMDMSDGEQTKAAGRGTTITNHPAVAGITANSTESSTMDLPSFLMFPSNSLSQTSPSTLQRSFNAFGQGPLGQRSQIICSSNSDDDRRMARLTPSWSLLEATFPSASARENPTLLPRSNDEGQNPISSLQGLQDWSEEYFPEPRPFKEE